MITDKQKDIIECMYSAWLDGDMPLYGHLCEQDVVDFMCYVAEKGTQKT